MEQTDRNPSEITRGRRPDGREPPVKRRAPLSEICFYACVLFWALTCAKSWMPTTILATEANFIVRWLTGSGRTRPAPKRFVLRLSQNCYGGTSLTSGLKGKAKSRLQFWSVFNRFPAKLGPKTSLNGSSSKNCAERTYNQPRR